MTNVIKAGDRFPTLGNFFKENPIFLNIICEYSFDLSDEILEPYDKRGVFSGKFYSAICDIFQDSDEFKALLIKIREAFLFNPKVASKINQQYTYDELLDILFYFRHIALESQSGERVIEKIFHDKLLDIIDRAKLRQVGEFGSEYGVLSRAITEEVFPINCYGEICIVLDTKGRVYTVLSLDDETVYTTDRLGRVLEDMSPRQNEIDSEGMQKDEIKNRREILGEIQTLTKILAYNTSGRTGELDAEIAMYENRLYTNLMILESVGFEGTLSMSEYERLVFIQIIQKKIDELESQLSGAPMQDIEGLQKNGMVRHDLVT